MAQQPLSEVLTELSVRLGDENNTFWSQNELYVYLLEALRVFNALTGWWKTEFVQTISSPFLNWYSTATSGSSPRQQTLTSTDIYNIIEYHLLEPATGGTWTGTNQFSIADLSQSMSRRRNEILQMAACNMSERVLACIPNTATVPVPDSALDVRRVRWVPGPGLGAPVTLQRGDTLSYQRFTPAYLQTNAQPLRWDLLNGLEASVVTPDPNTLLSLILDTLVSVPSQVQVLTIADGPDFAPPTAQPLLMPDDWTWVLKYGALADILSKEEEGRDTPRAAYCRQRYAEGIAAMQALPWLVQARINVIGVDTQSLAGADRTNYEWQSNAAAYPEIVIGGIDLYALSPVPTATTSVGLTVVMNAPVPTNIPTAPVYLPQDALEAVLLEATHLALFKMGGSEFSESVALHQGFIDFCMKTNSRLLEAGIFPTDYAVVTPLQETQDPRFTLQGGK